MADSYNELFGLGTYSPDSSLELSCLMQETSGGSISDGSGNSRNGTTSGMGASVSTAIGPSSWLSSAIVFDGVDDKIDFPAIAMAGNERTLLARIKLASYPPSSSVSTGFGVIGETPVAGQVSHYSWVDGKIYMSAWRDSTSAAGGVSRQTVTPVVDLASQFRDLSIRTAPVASGWELRLDGVARANATGISSVYSDGPVNLGHSTAPSQNYWLKGDVCDLNIFSRKITADEESEWRLGPEPINTVAPVLSGTETEGQTLSTSSGTWDSQSNGSITYSYQWTRSDDAAGTNEVNISGATSATYTLDAADEGKFIRCFVRGSNDGGFDVAEDSSTQMSGSIQVGGVTAFNPYQSSAYQSTAYQSAFYRR